MVSSYSLMLFVVSLILLPLLMLIHRRKRLPLPPGPLPLPIVGNIFNFRGKPLVQTLNNPAHTYGPLLSLQLGYLNVMVVSSIFMANEIIRKNDAFVSTRPVGDAMLAHRHNELSLICLPVCSRWHNLRKICNTQIFSNSRLEVTQALRQRKVEELYDYIHECSQDRIAVDVGQVVFTTSLKFLTNVFFSIDIANYRSHIGRDIKQLIWDISIETSKPNMADFFPILRILDPQGIKRRMENLFTQLMDIITKVVDQRLLQSPEFASHSDLLDCLLEEGSGEIKHSNMLHLFMDLIVAGTESISGMVEWTLSELLRHPEKLTKAKEELQQVIKKGKSFTEINISKTPYIEAIIKEIFRLHPIVPLIPRQVDIDIEICGYRVPKNSSIWLNTYAMGRDSRVWNSPELFEPERFLQKGINFEQIPFGGGRRICPALPLVMRMVPLILGSLIHSFDWELEVDPQYLDMDNKLGVTMLKAQPLCVIPICNI